MRLVDSHCHVNADRFEGDADQVLGAARLAGVERILVPGWNVASSGRALDLVERFAWLDASVGVHPHDAAKVDDAGWARIVDWASDERVVAIGETGLDYDRVFSPIDDQLTNLRRNLALALRPASPRSSTAAPRRASATPRTPCSRSCRRPASAAATWAAAFGDRPPVVIHSFSGPVDYARAMIDLGAAISFSGLVFRAGEETSAEVAAITPAERLLVETDSPFLAPPGAPAVAQRARVRPHHRRVGRRAPRHDPGRPRRGPRGRLRAHIPAARTNELTGPLRVR